MQILCSLTVYIDLYSEYNFITHNRENRVFLTHFRENPVFTVTHKLVHHDIINSENYLQTIQYLQIKFR